MAAAECAEKIALLHLLHEVPCLPFKDEQPRGQKDSEEYSLSFQQECDLVASLAYLSNISGSVIAIPALCVQQDLASSSLEVLLAVNRAKWEDGRQILKNSSEAFGDLFAVLAKADQDLSPSDFKGAVCTAIIVMSERRILRRLRLSSGNLETRNTMKKTLQSAIDALNRLPKEKLGGNHDLAKLFTTNAKAVVKSLASWQKHQKVAELEEVVKALNVLERIGNFSDIRTMFVLLQKGNGNSDQDRGDWLLRTIQKVSRYHDIARLLYRMATRCSLVRRMRLKAVELPQACFTRSEHHPEMLLDEVLRRYKTNKSSFDTAQIYQALNMKSPIAMAKFAQQVSQTMTESKIHAEVQLLFHLEMVPQKCPPRVIASSKDACYLCHALINMHGKFHMRRCHGRLYPGWRLPSGPGNETLAAKFNIHLGQRAAESLRHLSQGRKKTKHPHPNESNPPTLIMSSSSVHKTTGDPVAVEEAPQPETNIPSADLPSPVSAMTPVSGQQERVVESSSIVSSEKDDTLERRSQEFCSTSSASSAQQKTSHDSLCLESIVHEDRTDTILQPGEKHRSFISSGQPPSFHTALPLILHMQCDDAPSCPETAKSHTMSYSIEQLTSEEASILATNADSSVIDAENLQKNVDITIKLDASNCMYISAGRTVVRIKLQNASS